MHVLNRHRGRSSCRSCGGKLHSFVDLGVSPLCEKFLAPDQTEEAEAFYPLDAKVCGTCWLAQLGEYVAPADIFGEYAYFSSFSQAWLAHARDYALMSVDRFKLNSSSMVIEAASNDGYLLRNFVARGIPCLGIEPAANVARAAEAAGVPTRVGFLTASLGRDLAAKGLRADLLIGNNVLAQVPDLNDFVAALRELLKMEGVLTLEFPHLLRLLEQNQFDTIYHEHFSYFSLMAAEWILSAHGLRVFDVEELWTHGGSLRLYVCRADARLEEQEGVRLVRAAERAARLDDLGTYAAFEARVRETKWKLLDLLIGLKRQRAQIVGYGAPGKGNTLLNYCGIRTDFLDFTVDRNPYKHGKLLPGSRIPVRAPEELDKQRPDYVLILPWNLKHEIMQQLSHVRDWGGRFILPVPEPEIVG
ncbi:MAG: methyltransferase domain-containing protein [Alphaproteobacteria bacterium]|nr:methyltransferase domain-containing protein [Alphaproteobacteria bacterium]